MKLSIDIAEDQELRDFIKNLVKGQIKSVIRDEFNNLLKDSMNKKIEAVSSVSEIDKLIKNEIEKEVKSALKINAYGNNFIKEYASKIIMEKIEMAIKTNTLFNKIN